MSLRHLQLVEEELLEEEWTGAAVEDMWLPIPKIIRTQFLTDNIVHHQILKIADTTETITRQQGRDTAQVMTDKVAHRQSMEATEILTGMGMVELGVFPDKVTRQ